MTGNNIDMTLLSHRLDVLHEDVTEMKQALKELSTAVTKLALIEERQTHSMNNMERLFTSIEAVEQRLLKLEQHAPDQKRLNIWVDRATWAAFGLIAMFVLKKTGLML